MKVNKLIDARIVMIAIVLSGILGGILGFYFQDGNQCIVVDYKYSEDDLYEQRLISMDEVVDRMFPVHNQTVTITNDGYVPDQYDWENNTRVFDGGWIIHVNHSYYGEYDYLFDGWVLKKWRDEK